MTYKIIVVILLAIGSVAASAETRWVTDEFEVMTRSGKSTKQSIVRQLKSGTALEVLEVDNESGYSRVRTSSGAEGWVLSRYLRGVPTAGLRLPELERQLRDSEAQRAKINAELTQLKQDKRTLEREIGELQSTSSSQQSKLERITRLSADTIQVDQQNTELKKRLAASEQQIERLETENQQLGSRANREWFLIGGAVLVAGLLLGLILPRISWRKKSSWSDF